MNRKTQEQHSAEERGVDSVQSAKAGGIEDVQQWVSKAKSTGLMEMLKKDGADFFDLIIVNDDLERAYKELKTSCLHWFWQAYDE